MKKLFNYLSEHGFVVMMAGFGLAVVGLLFYMQTRYSGSVVPQIAFGVTIAGFVIYVFGRILVATKRKRTTKPIDTNIEQRTQA